MRILRQAQYLAACAVFVATILCVAHPCLAEDAAKKDRIDLAMEKAMDADPSTAGAVQAFARAEKQWDARLNSVYDSLHRKMVPAEWKALVAAQKCWLTFRDAQKKSIEETYTRMEGSMWIPVAASKSMKLTRERALYLQSLLENIEER
jgi:uncharacterized protein YecT (DUF1311 family)